jgi:hypothetical protein
MIILENPLLIVPAVAALRCRLFSQPAEAIATNGNIHFAGSHEFDTNSLPMTNRVVSWLDL